MPTSIASPITEKQARQYRRFVEDAARTGELSKRITQAVVDTTKTLLVNHRMKDLERQVNVLRYYFERNCYGLGRNDTLLWNKEWIANLVDAPLPPGMKWFAIPRWERIAETYEGAVKAVLEVVRERWRYEVCNYIDGADVDVRRNKNPGHPKQTDLSTAAWKKLCEEQGGDILVVPARLDWGIQPDGIASPLQNRIVFRRKFGLGAFAVGCMLLTYPHDKVPKRQILGDCVGDEFPSGNFPTFWTFGEHECVLAYGAPRRFLSVSGQEAWGYLWKIRGK